MKTHGHEHHHGNHQVHAHHDHGHEAIESGDKVSTH